MDQVTRQVGKAKFTCLKDLGETQLKTRHFTDRTLKTEQMKSLRGKTRRGASRGENTLQKGNGRRRGRETHELDPA